MLLVLTDIVFSLFQLDVKDMPQQREYWKSRNCMLCTLRVNFIESMS